MIKKRLWSEHEVPGTTDLLVKVWRHDSNSAKRWSNRRKNHIVGFHQFACPTWRILPLQSLSLLNLKRRIGDAGNVDIVKFSLGRLKWIDRLGFFENFAQRLTLPPRLHAPPPNTAACKPCALNPRNWGLSLRPWGLDPTPNSLHFRWTLVARKFKQNRPLALVGIAQEAINSVAITVPPDLRAGRAARPRARCAPSNLHGARFPHG